jgi:hypothetical protein
MASHEDDRAVAVATRVVEVRGGTTVAPVDGAVPEAPRAG